MRTSRLACAVVAGVIGLGGAVVSGGSASAGAGRPSRSAAVTTVDPGRVHVRLTRVVGGLSAPVSVTSAGDGSHRLFVVEQGGTIRVVHRGKVAPTAYLDISSEVLSGGEQGLLSVAFHPRFRRHPFLYVAYTRAQDGALQVSRFRAASASATSVAASTERRLLVVPHPHAANHNGGQLMFGRSGLLFIGTGDGGGSGDQFGHAEDLSSLSGKLLRINVDRQCGGRRYCIPSSNPFAGSSTKRPEIFDWGLRNPWRMSVDPADGRLWIGDVGQDAWEEIDHVRPVGGKDFGWSCREGRTSFNADRCRIGGKPRRMTAPVHVYHHDSVNGVTRCAVIGGYAYHGPDRPFAHGLYVYGDYCTGEIWALGRTSSGGYPNAKVGGAGRTYSITGFGEGDSGELYLVTQGGDLDHLVFTKTP